MASRIMHLAICNEIKKCVDLKDRDRFTIGQLLPDAIEEKIDEIYCKTHYVMIREEEHLKGYRFHQFYQEYKEKILEDDMYLGYYIHLIEDAIFRKFCYSKWNLLEKRKEEEYTKKIYEDYQMMNAYMIEKYHLENRVQIIEHMDFPAITDFDIHKLLTELNQDFESKANVQPLHYLKEEDIYEYIEKCVYVCVKEIKNIYNGSETLLNEEEFYWSTNSSHD